MQKAIKDGKAAPKPKPKKVSTWGRAPTQGRLPASGEPPSWAALRLLSHRMCTSFDQICPPDLLCLQESTGGDKPGWAEQGANRVVAKTHDNSV
jgi:hypothetical protein